MSPWYPNSPATAKKYLYAESRYASDIDCEHSVEKIDIVIICRYIKGKEVNPEGGRQLLR